MRALRPACHVVGDLRESLLKKRIVTGLPRERARVGAYVAWQRIIAQVPLVDAHC